MRERRDDDTNYVCVQMGTKAPRACTLEIYLNYVLVEIGVVHVENGCLDMSRGGGEIVF